MSDTVDQLVMLFSADWFRPHWSTLGIRTGAKAQEGFQRECQTIVRQIVGNAETYWLTSFEDERLAETQRQFLKSAHGNLDADAVRKLSELLSFGADLEPDEISAAAMASVNTRLAAGRDRNLPQLPGESQKHLLEVWQRYRPSPTCLEKAATHPSSKWDSYLLTLTPDLPTYLSDYLSDLLRRSTDVRSFWAEVTGDMPDRDKQNLLIWYRTAIASTLGEDFATPSWMTLR
jgi:hypothetical protein